MIEISKEILKGIYKTRDPNVKKYDFGLLVVIGGSQFYSGSPALSALAAFRAGVDMVRIVAPKRAADIIASFSPNLAAFPVKGDYLDKEDLPDLITMMESTKAFAPGKTAIAIGGGAGRTEEVQSTILEFLEKAQVPAVIDNDGLYAIAKKPELLKGKPFVLTPQTYEFFILTGKEIRNLPEEQKIKMVQEEAARLQTTILLKGPIDIVSDGKQVAVIRGGTPYMTKGGLGDALTGICGAFLARGINVFDSACAASYINKKAGEIVSEKLKESLMATDLIDAIPQVIN